jgi:hypothetical protein
MQAVLGIDAAWTLTQPSGVAAAVRSGSSWRLCGVADSYQRFYCLTDSRLAPEMKPSGSAANAAQLLATACQLCRASIELVAVDMPLARSLFVADAPPIMPYPEPTARDNAAPARRQRSDPASLLRPSVMPSLRPAIRC